MRLRTATPTAQFFTRNFILGMWRRRGALCLFGMEGKPFGNLSQSTRSSLYLCNNALGEGWRRLARNRRKEPDRAAFAMHGNFEARLGKLTRRRLASKFCELYKPKESA